MQVLYSLWQDPVTRLWHPVGMLRREGGRYFFEYTRGSQASPRFKPFPEMRKLEKKYESTSLFPVFANRLLPRNRPEFKELCRWADIDPESNSADFDLLAVTGGQKETDLIRLVPRPQKAKNGKYSISFFVHGLRHVKEAALSEVKKLEQGDELVLALEVNNQVDPHAISIRSSDPACLLGYVPRYYTKDLRTVLDDNKLRGRKIRAKKINPDAPAQLMVLCEVETDWPEDFIPFVSEEYLPLSRPSLNGKSQSHQKVMG